MEFEQDAFVGDAERVPFDFGIAGARTAWAVRLLAHGLQHAVHHKGDHLAGASFPEHTAHDAIDDDLGTLNGSLEGGRCLMFAFPGFLGVRGISV